MKALCGRTIPVVVVIDDDAEIRETLEDLISSVGLEPETFASVQDFLERAGRAAPAASFSMFGCPERADWNSRRSGEGEHPSSRRLHQRPRRRSHVGSGDEGRAPSSS